MNPPPRAALVARLEQAYALAAAGRSAEAEAAFRVLIAEDPACIPARDDLCVLLLGAGRAKEAEAEARASLALKPAGPDALNNLASALLRQQRGAEAQAALREALRLRPDFVEALYNLGWACTAVGDGAGAVAALRRVFALSPDDPRHLAALSAALRDQHWPDEALALAERAHALAPAQPALRITLARALRLAGALGRAQAVLEEVPAGARDAALLATLAQLQWEAGAMDAAIATAEAALALDPGALAARMTIAHARPCASPQDPNLLALEAAGADPALPADQRIRCFDAIGKCRDDLGEHPAAFARHRAANELRKQRGPRYDHARELAYVESCRELCADGSFVRLAEHGSRSELPVFVVGMPRSGTSLVEQIIAAHPAAHGCGELLEIPNLVRREPGYPLALRNREGAWVAATAERHLAGLVGRAGAAASRIVDKMPLNLRHLGLIHALFPRARIVVCRRQAADNCASLYFQTFGPGHEYRDDLVDLARFYASCQRLLALWQAQLPSRVLEVRYEDLVAAPELWSRRVIESLGLEWDERCLRSHESARAVRTASAWQVRQPIYTSSVGRWRRYGDAFAPLIGTLRAEGVEVEA